MAEWGKWDKFVHMCTLAFAFISGLYVSGRIRIPPLQVYGLHVFGICYIPVSAA